MVELGQLLVLVGMVILLLGGFSRQRARKLGKIAAPEILRQQRWVHGVAYALLVAGLLLMWGKK